MAVHIYTRDEWGAKAPRSMARQSSPVEAFLHHSSGESGKAFNTLTKQKKHMRDVQAFHMGPERGWSDIGYAFVVFQYVGVKDVRPEPRIFAARNWEYVPAAQLGHNTRTLPICVVGDGEHETLERETREAIAALIRKFSSVTILRPHGAVTQTACPGHRFRSAIPAIAKRANVRY